MMLFGQLVSLPNSCEMGYSTIGQSLRVCAWRVYVCCWPKSFFFLIHYFQESGLELSQQRYGFVTIGTDTKNRHTHSHTHAGWNRKGTESASFRLSMRPTFPLYTASLFCVWKYEYKSGRKIYVCILWPCEGHSKCMDSYQVFDLTHPFENSIHPFEHSYGASEVRREKRGKKISEVEKGDCEQGRVEDSWCYIDDGIKGRDRQEWKEMSWHTWVQVC